MPNINHLDASALNANGGAFEGLSRVLASIVERMARSSDRQGEVAYEDSRARYRERKADEGDRKAEVRQSQADARAEKRHSASLALQYAMHGIDPSDPKAAEKLAATVAKRQGTEAEQSQAMNALKLAMTRMDAIRPGDVAPMSPVAIEGQAAADGAADRTAKRTLAEEQANAIRDKDGAETLVEVLPDGSYRKLTEAMEFMGQAPAAAPQAAPADVTHHMQALSGIPDTASQAKYLAQLKREKPAVYAAIRTSLGN